MTTTVPDPALMQKLDDVRAQVFALGKTAEEIAQRLRDEGIKGVRKNSRHCAISAYVHKRFPGVKVRTGGCLILGDYGELIESLPVGHLDFVANFDNGLYPDLVAEI